MESHTVCPNSTCWCRSDSLTSLQKAACENTFQMAWWLHHPVMLQGWFPLHVLGMGAMPQIPLSTCSRVNNRKMLILLSSKQSGAPASTLTKGSLLCMILPANILSTFLTELVTSCWWVPWWTRQLASSMYMHTRNNVSFDMLHASFLDQVSPLGKFWDPCGLVWMAFCPPPRQQP